MTLRRLAAGSAALLAAGVVLSAGVSAGTSPAVAVDGGGTPGYCPTDDGVTVVVDFQELGGDIVVRCAPGPVGRGYTGLDALQGAGFTAEGVRRYGLAFVCRIAGRPTAGEELPIQGDPHYHEACLDTPPQQAFWGYWYAPNGGSWTYSQTAAISRDVIPGGFEGWSFSLNHEPGDSPEPGIAPKRPQAPPTTPPHTTAPTNPPHTHQQPTHPGSQSPGAPTTFPPTSPGSPTTSVTTGPARAGGHHGRGSTDTTPTTPGVTTSPQTTQAGDPVVAGHNRAGTPVTGELPQAPDPDGSPRTTIVGVGLVAVLATGAGFAAWRRRAHRE